MITNSDNNIKLIIKEKEEIGKDKQKIRRKKKNS